MIMEVGTRRIAQFNVTAHLTADWTLQRFREAITGEKPCRFLIHDRDRLYFSELDSSVNLISLSILKTPLRAPQASAFSEHLVRWETPRLCRGGSQSLTDPAVHYWEIDHDTHSRMCWRQSKLTCVHRKDR